MPRRAARASTTASGRRRPRRCRRRGCRGRGRVCTVQTPVPFEPAWSRMTSTSGLPVFASTCLQHLGGDLDQVALELALVPLGEDVGDLGRGLAGAATDEVVGLGDELHVGVLDAVVDHLDEVAGAVGADVGDAGLALGDGGDRLEDRAEGLPRLGGAARHDRRALERALLAAGDAGADEVDAGLAHGLLAADGVGEQRVAAVDDDVAGLEDLGRAASMTASVPLPACTMMIAVRGFVQRRGELLDGLRRRRSRPRGARR